MMRKQGFTVVLALLALFIALFLYLGRLITEAQCDRSHGAIDYEARVCIIGGVAHPLRESAIRSLAIWGGALIVVTGLIYGIARTIVVIRDRTRSGGAA